MAKKKKKWTLQELFSELNSVCDNPYARFAIECEFQLLATKNVAGDLVYENKDGTDAYSIAMNFQARWFVRHTVSLIKPSSSKPFTYLSLIGRKVSRVAFAILPIAQ